MEIKVENLGVITEGKIELEKNVVNVKYGINGSGKSTVSKGIELFVKNEDLNDLRTYGSEIEPTVFISEDISNVIVFNQDYVKNYLFKDDLANNSFEIMINTDEYKIGKKKIDDMFVGLITAINNTNTKTIIEELESLKNNVPIQKKETKTKGVQYTISGASKFEKARKVANLEDILDEKATIYKERLQSDNNHEWLKWFQAGEKYIEDNQICPFCLNELPEDFDEIYQSVETSVNVTGLKQNIEIKEVISNTSKYMAQQSKDDMTSIINKSEDLSDDEKKRLYEIVSLCSTELTKLYNLRSINVSEIKRKYEDNSLIEFLKSNTLEIKFYESLPDEVKDDIKNINDAIDSIITKSKDIESITKEFADKLNELVKNKKEYINNFLSISGIPYLIDIVENNNNFKTVLNPLSSSEIVTEKSLSFGEKNAISLMLFSIEASKSYDLIILDDPVSSFDNNKKFAILYYLFTKEDAVFKNKTVLLFTHDFDIVVDFKYKDEFKKIENKCYFVKNVGGNFVEKQISKSSVNYTIKHWKENSKKQQLHPLLRIVNLRKYLQYTCRDEEETAINILSSLEHNDEKPMKSKNGVKQEIIDKDKLDKGIKCIQDKISDFDYDTYLSRIQNKEELKELYNSLDSSISKLQILRMIVNLTGKTVENQVFWDYLTEYYHVENNEMTSLDEKNFDVVPNYIMKMSDEIIEQIFN